MISAWFSIRIYTHWIQASYQSIISPGWEMYHISICKWFSIRFSPENSINTSNSPFVCARVTLTFLETWLLCCTKSNFKWNSRLLFLVHRIHTIFYWRSFITNHSATFKVANELIFRNVITHIITSIELMCSLFDSSSHSTRVIIVSVFSSLSHEQKKLKQNIEKNKTKNAINSSSLSVRSWGQLIINRIMIDTVKWLFHYYFGRCREFSKRSLVVHYSGLVVKKHGLRLC